MVGVNKSLKDTQDPWPPHVGSGSLKYLKDPYRGTSLIIKRTTLGPYRRPVSKIPGGSWGVGRFLMGEVPLYQHEAHAGVVHRWGGGPG